MSRYFRRRMIIDAVMTVLLPLLMAYSLVGETLHEWIGAAMFLLFIAHHVLNRYWFRPLKQGDFMALQRVSKILDLLLFAVMLMQMASAVLISKHVFTFLGITAGASMGRIAHMLCAYWGFLLMSLHLGLHAALIMSCLKIHKKPRLRLCLRILFTAAAIYGIVVFFKRDFPSYLFARQLFVFIDLEEPLALCLLDHIAVMILFAGILHMISQAMRKAEIKKIDIRKREEEDLSPFEKEEREEEKRRKRRKRRRIVLAVLGVLIIAAALVWGIPYVRRHFVTVRIDRAQASAMGPVDLGKTLVICFTRTGNSNFEPDVDATSSASLMLDENDVLVGNAELLADMVKNATGGDIYPIRVAEGSRYPSSYGDTVSVAGKELDGAVTPVLDLSGGLPSVQDYDNIIVIYPIWWGTVPKAVEIFLKEIDWTGSKVRLVVTHGGSGAGACPRDMAAMLKGGTLDDNVLTVYDDDADEAADDVHEWLKSLK